VRGPTGPVAGFRIVPGMSIAPNPDAPQPTPPSEFAFINWVRGRTPPHPGVLVGPGDDTAVVDLTAAPTLVTTDMLLEGSCFLLAEAGARRVGRKAMAVNLSDIAAMAGEPFAAVVSVGLPRKGGRALAEELYLGMREVADAFQTVIIGGDTNSWDGPLAISVTLLGRVVGGRAVCRRGAEVGDWVMVTGPLGGSILGKHLDFTPRVHEAMKLHLTVPLHAMIDVSDGLAADLHHIWEESGCGAVLRAEAIPIADDAHKLQDGCSPLEHALGDGEDFELVFAVAPSVGRRLLEEQPIPNIRLHHIGEFVEKGLWLEENGQRRPLEPTGYVHLIE